MLVRNYAKPFCIAGFILAEIYMLFVMLAPNTGHDPGRTLLAPMALETAVTGAPVPVGYVIIRLVGGAIFFGPLGAVAGLGVGLLFSAVLQAVRRR